MLNQTTQLLTKQIEQSVEYGKREIDARFTKRLIKARRKPQIREILHAMDCHEKSKTKYVTDVLTLLHTHQNL